MSFAGYSQDTASTRIPNKDLRAAVKIIEGLRIDSLIMARDIQVLQIRVSDRNNIIHSLNDRIQTYEALKANYEMEIANREKQLKLSTDLTKEISKAIRRERTRTVIVGIIGLIITAGTFIIK